MKKKIIKIIMCMCVMLTVGCNMTFKSQAKENEKAMFAEYDMEKG